METNIAFVANGQKCAFFELIGKALCEKDGSIRVFWICISQAQFNYLMSRGHQAPNMLLLNWDIRHGNGQAVGEYKLNELASADRQLKHHYNAAITYLTRMQSLFYDFVVHHSLRFIFGETTWAHEILMSRICLDHFKQRCHYLHPQSIRIPNGRFTFLDSEFQNSIFSGSECIHPMAAINGYEIPLKVEVPERVADVAADVQSRLTWKYSMQRFLNFMVFNRLKKKKKYSDDLQDLGLGKWTRRKNVWQEEINKLYYTKVLRKTPFSQVADKPFFLVTLHLQPEASVDVVGRYYEDQLQLIKNVWRILPKDYYLLIKEHTNAIGNRGRAFFKQCKALANVVILNEWDHSHEILHKAETVFTNSGTIALEGALFGKDVFVLSYIFFHKLANCHKICLDDLKYSQNYAQLLKKCRARDKDKMSLEEYSKYIIRSSYPGIIDPHQGSSLFSDEENIQTISAGFLQFIRAANR